MVLHISDIPKDPSLFVTSNYPSGDIIVLL